MRKILLVTAFLLVAGCSVLGLTTPNVAADCAAQALVISKGAQAYAKLTLAEGQAFDAQIEISKPICLNPATQANPAAAAKTVEFSTAQMTAILAVASVR